MKVSEITISKYQLKQLFEEFNSKLMVDGVNAKYSWFIYKNSEAMAQEYTKLMGELYDERREPDFPAVFRAQMDLAEKYADRTEDGKIAYAPNGLPVYTEHAKEHAEEFAKLREQYSEFFAKLDKKQSVNSELFSQQVTVQVTQLELSEFPPNTKPYIIGLLGY